MIDKAMKPEMVIITDGHIYDYRHDKDVNQDGKYPDVYEEISSFERDYNVKVITTCPDFCNKWKDRIEVIDINTENINEGLDKSMEIVRNADVCILVDCLATASPVKDILSVIRKEARLLHCHETDGVNRLPRLANVLDAFKYSVKGPIPEGLKDIRRYLKENI